MEGILLFTTIVVIVFGVLQIVLFFKLWGMTNNVSRMRMMMEEHLNNMDNNSIELKDNKGYKGIKVEDLVVELKTERQMKVTNIIDGKYECKLAGGIAPVGLFNRNEIELFDTFYKK